MVLSCGGGHSAENAEKGVFRPSIGSIGAARRALDRLGTPLHHAPQLPPLNFSSSRSLGWPQRLAQTYIMELRELVRLDSVVAQLLKHRRSPPLCEGPRGPMVSYFGTLTGFHSAPSQPIVSRHHERALNVLGREHGGRNVSHQVLRSGLSSNALPSPPTVFSTLRAREASGPSSATPTVSWRRCKRSAQLLAVSKCKPPQRNSSLIEFNHSQ